MENITIRDVRKEDCPRLMELIHELAEYENAREHVVVSPAHFEQAGFGPDAVWKGFAAVSQEGGQETIIGFALYYIRYSTWKGSRLYLEDLVVTESWRGKGIGKMLFAALIEEGKKKQYAGMTWQVLEWNEPAINFYNKYGAAYDKDWWNATIEF
jgi:GNAT superfamily N-acetyltransferase